MDFVIVDIANPGVTQPLGSLGKRWLCRDIYGVLHCTYNKYFSTGARWRVMHGYSSDNGATWTLEEVPDAPAGTGSFAMDSGILTDSVGRVHIIYEYRAAPSTTHYLKHAIKMGGSWSSEDVTTWVAYSANLALAGPFSVLDSFDHIHILFSRQTGSTTYELRYISNVGGSWGGEVTVMTATSFTALPQSRSLCVDVLDNLHFVYSLSADRTKIRYRQGVPWGAEQVIETFGFNAYPDDVVASNTELTLGIYRSGGANGYLKRKPTPGAWEAAEAVFTPDTGFYISDSAPIISTAMKEGLIDLEDNDTNYYFKMKLWQKIGGVWLGSPYQSAPDQIEDSWGYALSHLYPSHFGAYPGLAANNEIIMFREIYSDIINDYGVAFMRGIFPPLVTAKPAQGSIAHRLVSEGAI